jgi:RND family efflux transporter MFP subunit
LKNHWVKIMNKLSLTITLLYSAVLACGCTEARTADLTPPTPVKTHVVEAFAATNELRYSATIRPSTQMELSFKNGGFVDSIQHASGRLIEQGDKVVKGAVLAQLRQADFEHRVDQTTAQLAEARFALESAKAKADDSRSRVDRTEQDFVRAEKLYNTQSLTKPNYDAAKAEYDSARAKLESAKADIDSAQARARTAEAALADARLALQDTAVTAPMDGTVISRNIEIGSLAGAGKPAFVLADTHTVKALFGVPDLEIRNVRQGMAFAVTTEALPGEIFMGRVTSVSPAADEKSRVFDAELTIANPKNVLKPGMIASVVIGQGPSEKLTAIPLSAVVRSKDGADSYAVFVIEMENGQPLARLRSLKLGDALGNMIVVKEGLKTGESVISVGATLVHDGSPVQIVP